MVDPITISLAAAAIVTAASGPAAPVVALPAYALFGILGGGFIVVNILFGLFEDDGPNTRRYRYVPRRI